VASKHKYSYGQIERRTCSTHARAPDYDSDTGDRLLKIPVHQHAANTQQTIDPIVWAAGGPAIDAVVDASGLPIAQSKPSAGPSIISKKCTSGITQASMTTSWVAPTES
jgi:hypothetical protein